MNLGRVVLPFFICVICDICGEVLPQMTQMTPMDQAGMKTHIPPAHNRK